MSAVQIASETESYLENIRSFHQHIGETGPSWMRELRGIGSASFEESGFPTARDEEWKYTSVQSIARGEFGVGLRPGQLSRDEIKRFLYESSGWTHLVFVDGRFSPSLSSMPVLDGADIVSLEDGVLAGRADVQKHLGKHVKTSFNAFTALNAAFLRDGAYIRVRQGEAIETPIHLLFVASAAQAAAYPRNLIVLEKDARATVVESYVSVTEDAYLVDTVTEIALEPGANLDYYRVQQEGLGGHHISVVGVQQSEESVFSSVTVNLGAALARNDLNIRLEGQRCECTMLGLSLVDGVRHVDNHTALDHASPNCESHELYKSIVNDRGRSVFNGKIYVHPGAQKTDARQTNRNLLLSKDATVDTKPQLEIFADDVKCTHGATVGQLDEDQMFYLRSRGMSEERASQLLTYGFANDIVEKVKLEALRHYLHQVQMAALHQDPALLEELEEKS